MAIFSRFFGGSSASTTPPVGLGVLLDDSLSQTSGSVVKYVAPGLIYPSEDATTVLPLPPSREILKTGLKVAALAVGGYVAYKTLKWYIKRKVKTERSSRAEYIRELGLEVLEHMKNEAGNEVPDMFYEEPVLPEGLISEEERGMRSRRRHKSAPFLAKITHLAKNHFGGVPEPTKANVMAVTRLVYELCKEHNCLPHQTRHIISVVSPLILTPDQFDLSSRALLNCDQLASNRAEHADLANMEGWFKHLVHNPLSATAWRRAMDVLVGLPDWQAFRIIH